MNCSQSASICQSLFLSVDKNRTMKPFKLNILNWKPFQNDGKHLLHLTAYLVGYWTIKRTLNQHSSVWKQLKRRLVTLASSLLEDGRKKILSVNRPSSAKIWHYLALRKSVLLPIKTASTHVTNKLPTLPIFRTVHDTSNVWPENAFGGARTCSTLKSGNALVWNPQTGLGIKVPELRTYSILHSKRLSAG